LKLFDYAINEWVRHTRLGLLHKKSLLGKDDAEQAFFCGVDCQNGNGPSSQWLLCAFKKREPGCLLTHKLTNS
jgi:hypothetical protein